uniref:OSBS enolase-like N-terminal domain-containing protein n=1 Tax=Odontella aurita TaxID=265563 RepID=A0A7S4K895_9STRA|mmetsp:Transcript_6630/g.19588  ORF Transcript_6630/g.19588 Transcript_6630/m.19588 type:complete len:1005 (+) Transcript_6630:3328-6342(+)
MALGIDADTSTLWKDLSINGMAKTVLTSLRRDHGIKNIDAIAGYSLGGRVAMAMSRIYDQERLPEMAAVSEKCKLVLLSANPGSLPKLSPNTHNKVDRIIKDDRLSHKLSSIWLSSQVNESNYSNTCSRWSNFLSSWYGADLWGNIRERRTDTYSNMILKRAECLKKRGPDLAFALKACSPPRNVGSDWSEVKVSRKIIVTGEYDEKYSKIGHVWKKQCPELSFSKLPGTGHALLVESPDQVADVLSSFVSKTIESAVDETAPLSSPTMTSSLFGQTKPKETTISPRTLGELSVGPPLAPPPQVSIELLSLDYEMFSIEMRSNGKTKGILGIGWGDSAKPNAKGRLDERHGFVVNLISRQGELVGIGEVSPLKGLHQETLEEAEALLDLMRERLQTVLRGTLPVIDAEKVLMLDGALSAYVDGLFETLGLSSDKEQYSILSSVRSGLEMAIISLASQACKSPLPQALAVYAPGSPESPSVSPGKLLSLNGIRTRDSSSGSLKSVIRAGRRPTAEVDFSFPSVKVKVGHQSTKEDVNSLVQSLSSVSSFSIDDKTGKRAGGVRADANRAWDEEDAVEFASALEHLDPDVIDRIEFIEEPLKKVSGGFLEQVKALEDLYKETGIKYALDESIADLGYEKDYEFDAIRQVISEAFIEKGRVFGCAAFILKPALLGIELSMRLARMAHNELGVGAVFSSSFDSGIGLTYAAFLASISDGLPSANTLNKYPHGLGTFNMLKDDTLSPPFKSYVKRDGTLQVATLGRALYGLGLDDIRESFSTQEQSTSLMEDEGEGEAKESTDDDTLVMRTEYQASASTSSTRRDISVQVSLPLPFSDEIALSRFGDLPQQPRWSPWLNSVAYLDAGGETEWTLNVRGVTYRWRAISKILDNPRGIMWESVSGLKNKGVVEFIPSSKNSCLMKVKMSIITPRVLASVFQGTSSFVKEFLQNKLLKWSLESFRDVVKADLALERGDVELGDALFGAVEGKMSAIEATLSYPNDRNKKQWD